MTQRAILRIHFHHGGNEDLYHQLLTVLDGISPRWQPQPPTAADHDVTGALKYFDLLLGLCGCGVTLLEGASLGAGR